jgi:hypothetical protein
MSDQDHPIELLIICAVIVIFSLLGIVGGISGKLAGSLDGLLLIAICLVMFLVFSILLGVLAWDKGWLGKHGEAAPAAAKK